MIPTPEQVLPLLAPLASAVPAALRQGMEAADALQPEPAARDNYFWSHSARFYNKRELARNAGNGWLLLDDVPNTGIHIVLQDVHRIRVLRSLNGTVPHPGRNLARRDAWAQPPGQGEFFLSADNELSLDNARSALPAMNLLIDWHQEQGEPVICVSLPRAPWSYQDNIRVYWRKPFPTADEFANMRFAPPPVRDDFSDIIRIDPGERDAG